MGPDGEELSNPELILLRNNKLSGFRYRQRRQEEWTENYTLYRDRVIVNRLTQRQSVNLPIMKQQIRTLLKDVDDMPLLYFENLDSDKEKEVFQNEYWKIVLERNKADLKDIVDKRQVFLFGRSFDSWQIIDGMVRFFIEDPEDILIDRYMDPTDIDSSRFLIHTHIFKPLSTLSDNPDYDQEAVRRLQEFYVSEEGIIKSKSNAQSLALKNQKLADIGLGDVESPILGETYVELSLHFVFRKEDGDKEEQIYMYVEADEMEILMKKTLEEVIGVTKDNYWQTHYPYNTWADDVDKQDFWTDGVGDMLRTPNKVANAWFSQQVESRTLANLGMHYYDSTIEGFNPQTFTPIPFGWYGVPGKPADVMQKVDIDPLDSDMNAMEFLISLSEKASGATTTQQGAQSEKSVTLGEVQLALGEAKERIKGMSKFYTPAWKSRGEKFLKMVEAGADKLDAVKIYKKGRNSNEIYKREISPTDWMSESGYTTRVWSQDEKNNQDMNAIQKLNAIVANIPGNPKLIEIYQRKLLEFGDLTPDEMNEVLKYEEEKRKQVEMSMNQGAMMGGQPQPDQGIGAQFSQPQPQGGQGQPQIAGPGASGAPMGQGQPPVAQA